MNKNILLPLSLIIILLSLLPLSFATNAQDKTNKQAQKLSIDNIISSSRAEASKQRKENKSRESRFKAEKNKQQSRFNSMVNQRVKQENISEKLEAEFKVNEKRVEVLTADLAKELGDLKELFGVIQQTASDARENYRSSIISAQFPERTEDLRKMVAKMGNTTQLISIEEIEAMWFHLQNEMTQQGKIIQFDAELPLFAGMVEDDSGELSPSYKKENRRITRVGVFNAVSQDDIAIYDDERGLSLLERKMDRGFIAKSRELQAIDTGIAPFYIDPTRGALLSALVNKPSALEKIKEGKIVGYIIIVLGCIAMLIAVLKIIFIRITESKVNKQAKNTQKPVNSNPLGRVLTVFFNNPQSDPESMELKLSEAVLKETPRLHSWLLFVKIIAVVAPLLGLLGTVTGMIQTFQSITLYGAGDPQLMAGGISQALVTTVLGLLVAIPVVLLHSSAAGRAKRVEGVLEEHVAGLVAKQINTQSQA